MSAPIIFHQISPSELINLIIKALHKYDREKEKAKGRTEHLSKKGFARKVGKSTSWVDQERRAGRLKSTMIGGTVAILTKELEKYI